MIPRVGSPRAGSDEVHSDDAPTGPVAVPTPREDPRHAGADVADGPEQGGADGAVNGEGDGDGAEDTGDADSRTPTLLDQMGGVAGLIASSVPAVVFVVVQAVFATLVASVAAAVVAALAIAVWRLVRGEALQPAFAGLFGVAVCAFVAWRTGEAKGFFLLGIWTSLVYGGVFLVSIVVRRPLVGVIWHGVNGDGQRWRRHPAALRAYSLASLAWVFVFGARFVVQRWLYDSAYADAWLGWVRIAMGVPLAAVAALATVWAIRRATAALTPARVPGVGAAGRRGR